MDTSNWIKKSIKFSNLLNGRKTDHRPRNVKKKQLKQCDEAKLTNSNLVLLPNDQQVDNCLNTNYSTIQIDKFSIDTVNKPNKSSKISFFNSALQSVKIIKNTNKSEFKNIFDKKNNKSECTKHLDKLNLPSVYLEAHKAMDWRLQQLIYQLPEQDELLLADNPNLSKELKFLRSQQKLCLIPVKLFLNNSHENKKELTNSSVQSKSNTEPASIFCNKCEQVINTYCLEADLSKFSFFLSKSNNNKPINNQKPNAISTDEPADNSVNQSKITPAFYFHIECLQCITCNETLIDFRAFLDPRTKQEDLKQPLKIYCSRHFLELFKPRCELCDSLIIFEKKCTLAEGKIWHVEHFCCFQCKIPLGGQQYKMADLNQKRDSFVNEDKMKLEDLNLEICQKQTKEEIHPFCLSCYDQLFSEFCETCGESLVNSDLLPNSSTKQIFCSTKCAQALQAKDLNNLNSGLMKLNDRLRNQHHKPTLNSVKEEDEIDNRTQVNKVEYENSSMFHLAKSNSNNLSLIDKEEVEQNNNHQINSSPSSNRSSTRSLSSLSLLFSNSSNSSPDGNEEKTDNQQEINKKESAAFSLMSDSTPIKTKNSLSIKSVCSNSNGSLTLNQLNFISTSTIAKEIKSTDSEKIINSDNERNQPKSVEKLQTENSKMQNIDDSVNEQGLVPYMIVNNNPFTRKSIIIDNLNTTMSTMQILDDEFIDDEFIDNNEKHNENCNSCSLSPSSLKSAKSFESDKSIEKIKCLQTNNDKPDKMTESTDSKFSYSTLSKSELNSLPLDKKMDDLLLNKSKNQNENINISLLSNALNNGLNDFKYATNSAPTHYSTLPTRRTRRKPFKFEEPTTKTVEQQINNYYYHNLNNNSTFPVTQNSSQSILKVSSKPVDSMNEVGLPVVNNKQINHFENVSLSNFVNCTLPRSNRHSNNVIQKDENSYLNGVQSVSVSKLNATMLQSNFNRLPKYFSGNSSWNNLSIDNSTNSNFSSASSSHHSTILTNNSLNSHSVVVSEDQIGSLNSQLIVKPLPNSNIKTINKITNNLQTRTPPPLPPADQHGFIKKWSTTNAVSNNQLSTDLPIIQENNIVSNASNHQTSSEHTSSTTPSLSSSIEMQSNDANNLISIQNFSSSNNSLNTINLIQTTSLNSSNSASLISATSSISSPISSSETTPQLSRTSLIHHNRPDVISHLNQLDLNPIETIKQLKQKQRELKLKEKMLKQKAEKEQQQSIDLKPKIIKEKLKTSTPTGKKNDVNNLKAKEDNEVEKELLFKSEANNNTKTMSTNNLNEIQQINKLNNSVSNSLSSLNCKIDQIKKQQQSANLLPVHRSQPNLLLNNSSNGETCSNSSTPDPQLNSDRIQQLNQINHLNQLNKLSQINEFNHHLNQLNQSSTNPSPSSQYSPTNSLNDTDSSSVPNSVEMDNIVQFKNSHRHSQNDQQQLITNDKKHSPYKKRSQQGPQSLLKDSQLSNNNLKQKSVSFDPNVIENENNKAPKRLNRKIVNGQLSSSENRYSSRRKYHDNVDDYEPHRRSRKRNCQRNHRVHHYKSSANRRNHRYYYEEDDCSTCSSSCSSSTSYCSSSSEDEDHHLNNYSCHNRKSNDQIKKQKKIGAKAIQLKSGLQQKLTSRDTLTTPANNLPSTTSKTIAPEKMVKIMQQQQLIIQQQLAQMQPKLKQQRYLKNNTESCVIS